MSRAVNKPFRKIFGRPKDWFWLDFGSNTNRTKKREYIRPLLHQIPHRHLKSLFTAADLTYFDTVISCIDNVLFSISK